MSWVQVTSTGLSSFLASLVEFVEALTIVLAVGATRGFRPALTGVVLGVLALVLVIACAGQTLLALPFSYLQCAIGFLLFVFGLRWLKKAILRAAGFIALHDEAKIFAKESKALKKSIHQRNFLFRDPLAVLTSFKAVLLEGLEVAFIVVATSGAARSFTAAISGAAAAAILVSILGFVLHRPLTRVPENQLKLSVGIILSAFGIFWMGEGLGFSWPFGDFAVIGLIGILITASILIVEVLKKRTRFQS